MDHLNFQSVRESLPKLLEGRFMSPPVIFTVGDKRYAGHYHMNGFFYSYTYEKMIAKTDEAEFQFPGNTGAAPFAELWCYL